MTRIVGWQTWKHRIESLKSTSGRNPVWDSYLQNRHGLELAFGEVHHHLQTRGRCPWPPRTAEEYRLYSFMGVAVRVHECLSEAGQKRFSGSIRSGLEKEFGLGPIAFEMKIVAHLMARGFDIEFHDLESGGGFDFLANQNGTSVEVECKHVSADIGRQIHRRKLYEMGGDLFPYMSETVDQRSEGYLVQVILPGRLTNDAEQRKAIKQRISDVLVRQIPEMSDEVCDISLQKFSLEDSPFTTTDGRNLTSGDIESFLESRFGVQNSNVLLNWRPGRAAVIVQLTSTTPDKVLGRTLEHLKSDSKRQFSGKLPAYLCVHFADLTQDQLFNIYNTSRSGEATGIEIAVNHLLDRRPHLYAIAMMSDGEVRLTKEQKGGQTTETAVQEVGPSWVVRNSAHELADTNLLDELFI